MATSSPLIQSQPEHPSEHFSVRKERPFERLDGKEALRLIEDFHASAETLMLNDGQQLLANDFIPVTQIGRPIVFVSGYYAEGDSLRQPMYDSYLEGRRSLCFNAYHGIDLSDEFLSRYTTQIEELRLADPSSAIEPQLRKAAALIEMLDAKGLKSVDVFGHSEGAIVATIAAHLRPDLFCSKVLACPAGMIGDQSVSSLKMRKVADEISILIDRLAHVPSSVTTATRASLEAVLPKGTLTPTRRFPVLFRQFSPRYGEDPAADLGVGQYIGVKGAVRTIADWFRTQMRYFTILNREYSEGVDKGHLQAELESLTKRRLERWLSLLDPEKITIAAGGSDRLYPAKEVAMHAAEAGIDHVVELKGASHNVQHFKPDVVYDLLKKTILQNDRLEPTKVA